MSRQPVRTFFPQTRLAELAARPGGIARGDAIEGAQKSIENLRGEGDATIVKSIGAIAAIVRKPGASLLDADMTNVLRLADQIVTLAGTFCYPSLDKAARSLCDLTDGLVRNSLRDKAPIAVHAQSMQLMAPGSNVLSPGDIEKVLAELAKVVAHYGFSSLDVPGVAEDGEIALAG